MSRKTFLNLFKATVFLLMLGVIIRALFIKNDWTNAWSYFLHNLNTNRLGYLLLATVLMPANWLIETYKWKLLLGANRDQFGNLLRGILAGVTFGFVTPGRSGEFVGRAWFADDYGKINAFYQSAIGGLAQTAVTLIAGIFFISYWSADSFLSGVAIGFCMVFLFIYFRFDWINRILHSLPFLRQRNLTIVNNQLPELDVQIQVLLVSAFRYLIYLGQYVLLFYFFGVSDHFVALWIYCGVLLVVQSFSPLMPLLDVSYRGGAALFVFQSLSTNVIGIVCGALSVWLINLAIPALVGFYFIFHKKTY